MQKPVVIDYARLHGFAAVSDQLSGNVDFQDEILGAKLGAKRGDKAKLLEREIGGEKLDERIDS
jgi:hypothetical protein